MNVTARPDRITSRSDAAQLWRHLLERGIHFRVEEDPAEWGLGEREVVTLRRLFGEVDRLGRETFDCYADADSLRQLALLGALGGPPAAPRECRSPQPLRARPRWSSRGSASRRASQGGAVAR